MRQTDRRGGNPIRHTVRRRFLAALGLLSSTGQKVVFDFVVGNGLIVEINLIAKADWFDLEY